MHGLLESAGVVLGKHILRYHGILDAPLIPFSVTYDL